MSRGTRRPVTALGWRAWLRQAVDAPSVPATLAIAAFVTAGCLSVVPRIVEHASSLDLQAELDQATPPQRDVQLRRSARIGVSPSGDPFDTVRRQGAELLDQLPESVTSVIAEQRFVVDSPRFDLSSYPDEDRGPFPTTFTFRSQDAVDEHMTLVDGRMPVDQPGRRLFRGTECPPDVSADRYRPDPDDPEVDCDVIVAPVIETVITADTADAIGLGAGDEAILTPDPRDLGWRQATGQQFGRRFVVHVAGIVELSDQQLPYWFGDPSLHRPRITENADYRLVFATGLLPADRYGQFLRTTTGVPLDYTWRCTIDVDLVDTAHAAEIANDLDRIALGDVTVETRLPDLLRRHLAQRSVTIGVMSVIVSGALAATIGGLAAVAMMTAHRHRIGIRLTLRRGAGTGHIAVDGIRTGVTIAVPAAAIGWLATKSAFPDTGDAAPTWWAVVAAAVSVALMVAAMLASALRASGPSSRTGTNGRRPARFVTRRMVAETLVVAVAAGAVVLVRRRGEISDAVARRDLDPLLAVAAGTAALAGAIVVVRVLPSITGAIAALAARRRGAVVFVGARRAASTSRTLGAAWAVVAGSITIAVFATMVAGTVERTQHARSWSVVGGDFRIESAHRSLPLAAFFDVDDVLGSAPFAGAVVTDDVSVAGPAGPAFASLTALRLDEYVESVAAGGLSPAESDALTALRRAVSDWDPDGVGPTPALVSATWPASTALRVGDIFSIGSGSLGSGTLNRTFYAVAVVDTPVGADPRRPSVVVDLATVGSSSDDRATAPNAVIGRASRAELGRLEERLADVGGNVLLQSRYDALDEAARDPFSRWTRRTLVAVAVLAGAVAMLAAVAGFEISAERRARELSILRTLGLRRAQALVLLTVEQLPAMATTLVLATGAGIAVDRVLHPALHLERLTTSSSATAPTVDWARLAAVAGAVAVALAIVTAITVWRLVRRNDASMLRTGDDR